MKNLWVTIREILVHSPWEKQPYEVFYVNSYMGIFCSSIALVTALAILIEIRKGPWFVTQVLVAIITASTSNLIVEMGFVLNWFDSFITHAIGIFFFCLYMYLDIVIYLNFALRYWETSFHINSYLRR